MGLLAAKLPVKLKASLLLDDWRNNAAAWSAHELLFA